MTTALMPVVQTFRSQALQVIVEEVRLALQFYPKQEIVFKAEDYPYQLWSKIELIMKMLDHLARLDTDIFRPLGDFKCPLVGFPPLSQDIVCPTCIIRPAKIAEDPLSTLEMLFQQVDDTLDVAGIFNPDIFFDRFRKAS